MNNIERVVAQEVHERVFLYDLLHPSNLDQQMRAQAFQEMSLTIRQEFPEVAKVYDADRVVSIYNNLRRTYVLIKRKIIAGDWNFQTLSEKRKDIYDAMSFLKYFIRHRSGPPMINPLR
ncbi:uncharacterized protein LOC107980655 [Nasonia vitripennis]|uniref:MADF domain-containing protein n=1 Tax=Nasonia vitripennis TaxID=7425 RepID=A0A7M7T806_NASVI|nr:uncharacterized protein LOC107980655 [Nasonia vitripennis]XP_031781302.1 uncharacterized protein LOC107980655 [Nasonia vitripennis]